jgi:serine/threonine protein kinase
VYAGIDPYTGIPIVHKVFPSRIDRETRAGFDREQAALATLRHLPSILQVDEIQILADGRPMLRMARCPRSLAQLTTQLGQLSPADTVVIGETVALALAAAHGAGVVHGGVSPHNVLLRPTGEPVLADLGTTLRQWFPRVPESEVDYLAPETLRDGTMNESSDLYGLGAVLHLALTGASPYPPRVGEQQATRILRVLSEPVAPVHRPDVPVELATLVARLLARDPAHRPASAADVAAQLTAMLPAASQEPDFGTPALPAEPLVEIKPQQGKARKTRIGIPVAAAGIMVAALVPALLSLGEGSAPTAQSPTVSQAAETPPPSHGVLLELDTPADHGDYVELTWRASGDFYFAVFVAVEGQGEPKVMPAQHRRTMRVEVVPGRMYCFQVQATDRKNVYTSLSKPIRGAVCKG